MEGWIKSHRAMFDNPIVCKDTEHFAVWSYLLHHAAHAPLSAYFNGDRIELRPGQLITGRKKIASHFGISESKVRYILDRLEINQQINREPSNASTLISITNWGVYQNSNQPNNQPLTNHQPTINQPLTTIKECKNIRSKECNNNTHIDSLNLKISSRACVGDAHSAHEAREVLDWIATHYPDIVAMTEPLDEQQAVWLADKYTTEDIQRIIMAMDNKGATKNKSTYATFASFARHDVILKERKEAVSGKLYTYNELSDMVGKGRCIMADFTPTPDNPKLWVKVTDRPQPTNA